MLRNRTRKSAFTLVEILIVVIILGILAAIVIPQFTSASSDARDNSTRSQLQTLRSQIELYKLQHGDQLPDLITNWNPMLNVTAFGGVNYGPYLQSIPKNAINGMSNVVQGVSPTAASVDCGFIYDFAATGRIWATDTDMRAIFAD